MISQVSKYAAENPPSPEAPPQLLRETIPVKPSTRKRMNVEAA